MKAGWTQVALGEVCEVVGGGTPKTSVSDYWDGDILWATPKDLSEQRQRHITQTTRRITAAGLRASGARILPTGSVLLSSRAPIGLVAINDAPMATNQGFKSLVPNPAHADAGYIAHWLSARTSYLQSLGTGATFKEISKRVVEKIELPLPPLHEQLRIGRVLDAAVEIEQLRMRALSVAAELLSSRFEELFGSTKREAHWDRVAVRDFVARFSGGKSFAGVDNGDADAPHRVLRVSAVTSGQFRPEESRPVPRAYDPPLEHYVKDGDLLISRANTAELVGAVALVETCPQGLILPDKVWRFVWRDPAASVPEFVWQLFRTREMRQAIQRRATGTSGSMKNISAQKLMGIEVTWPPIRQQREFAQVYRAMAPLRRELLQHLSETQALFVVLQHRAFAGEL